VSLLKIINKKEGNEMIKRNLIFVLVWVFFIQVVFAEIQTQLDRNAITVNESFNLTISSNQSVSGSPNWGPLNKDFYLAGTAQKTQLSIINGKISTEKLWSVQLTPKHSGRIDIPSLQIGDQKSQPLVIDVTEITASNSPLSKTLNQNKDIFMEILVNPRVIYLKGQLTYTVKLYFRRSINDAFLGIPTMSGATLTSVGQDIYYTEIRKGNYYRVLERAYVISPHKSGHLTITAPKLTGYINRNPDDLYDFDGFMASSAAKPVRITGPTVTVAVKPMPSNFAGQRWLPAKHLTLHDAWSPNPPLFRVGEPVTRQIIIEAEGVKGDELPPVATSTTSAVNIYPEQPQFTTHHNDQTMLGVMKQNIVIVPTQVGELNLPAIQIHWWDTISNKERIATLPARKVNVLPALIPTATTTPVKKSSQINSALQSLKTNQQASQASPPTLQHFRGVIYLGLAVVSLLLAVAILTLWLKRRRKLHFSTTDSSQTTESESPHQSNLEKVSLKSVYNSLKQACETHQPEYARRALLDWAQLHWSAANIRYLSDVQHLLTDAKLNDQIIALEQILYGKIRDPWQGEQLWQCFVNYLDILKMKQNSKPKQDDSDILPPLYPPLVDQNGNKK
jgi:BatD DUF11 like domain